MKVKIFLFAALALSRISFAQSPSPSTGQSGWQLSPPFETESSRSSPGPGSSGSTKAATSPSPAGDQKSISALSYVEGSIWVVTFVKTKAGLADDYFKSISASLKPVYEEEKKQKMILDYKVLSTEAGDNRDFNVIIMVEYPSVAAIEGSRERIEPVLDKFLGSADARREIATRRSDVRDILATKTMREIWLK